MQQYRITTCEPESCCVSAVAIENGQLKITLENGQEFTAALPTDKHVTGASVSGDELTLTVDGGSPVTLDLSDLLNPIRQNAVASGELEGEAIQLKNEAGRVVSTIDLSGLTPDDVVASGVLEGANLLLKDADGATLSTINLSSLIPAAAADRFLSEVVYRDADKKLVFTTSAQGEENQTFEVAVEDFMRVATDATLTGNGTTSSPLSVVSASTTTKGVVELATPTETKAGTDNTRAVTPAGLKSLLDGLNLITGDLLGKGLVFNPETNKWEVNATDANGVTVNPDGTVGLKLSDDSGNMLELRDDGLYYGTVAPEELRALYVSSTEGNDDNTGTRAAPLRTLNAALGKLKDAPYSYTIYLKEGEVFELTGVHSYPLARIDIMPYGAQTDGDFAETRFGNAFFRGYVARDFNRPTINVRTTKADVDGADRIVRGTITGEKLAATGSNIHVYNDAGSADDGSLSGMFRGVLVGSSVTLHGTTLEVKTAHKTFDTPNGQYRNDVYLVGDLQVINSSINLDVTPDVPLISPTFTSAVVLTDWVNPGGSLHNGTNKVYEPLIDAAGMKTQLTLQKALKSIPHDATYRTLYGTSVNWDIFAAS